MDANTQLANDVHFLTAPFRFLWHSILWLLFLLFAPLLFLTVPFILIAADPNADFGVIALFYMVTGPFVCCFWMCLGSYLVSIRQIKREGKEFYAFMPGVGSRYARCFGYMLFGFFGSLIGEVIFYHLFGTPDMGNPCDWALWFAVAPFVTFSPMLLPLRQLLRVSDEEIKRRQALSDADKAWEAHYRWCGKCRNVEPCAKGSTLLYSTRVD